MALVPFVANAVCTASTLGLLAAGTVFYAYAETRRNAGVTIPIITRITELSSRKRDLNRFVLGPITLGIGAMLALLLYPNPAATIAIYALAFGDGFASLFGKIFGKLRIPATGGKTILGSLAWATAVTISTYAVVPVPHIVIPTAIGATLLEVLPTGDADNLILPVGVGLVASILI